MRQPHKLEDMGSTPTLSALMPCGVIGNISLFEREDSKFEPWRGNHTPVAQLEEAASLSLVSCPKGYRFAYGFKSHQEY